MIVPPYALFRDPANFSPNPDMFWPDRWLGSAEKHAHADSVSTDKTESSYSDMNVVTNTAAFIPFSYGPANCAGKSLAILEMRIIVALLMQHFEIQFAPGFDPKKWEEHLEDFFVAANGALPVTLTPRA